MTGKVREITASGLLDDYMDEAECAAGLGIAPITLARWRGLKKGPPYTRVSRRILYHRQGTKAWVAAQEQQSEHPKRTAKRKAANADAAPIPTP
jgi:hypothetical protein